MCDTCNYDNYSSGSYLERSLLTEEDYQQKCFDLCFDVGISLYREGADAVLDLGIPGVLGRCVLFRPMGPHRFWEDTWATLQLLFESYLPINA